VKYRDSFVMPSSFWKKRRTTTYEINSHAAILKTESALMPPCHLFY
jgi:hypothetical protein